MTSVVPLFSYPLMICSENYAFTDTEASYISELAMTENAGNYMSQNDKILDSTELSKLKTFIATQISIYKKKILRMKDENEIYITQSWANKARTNDFHPKHKHPNSILSGVLFVTGNEEKALPPLRFHRTNDLFPLEFEYEELNDFNAGSRWFDLVPGRLILFPSVLEHGVDKNDSGIERVTLSFNTFVRGSIGATTLLTQVEIPK